MEYKLESYGVKKVEKKSRKSQTKFAKGVAEV